MNLHRKVTQRSVFFAALLLFTFFSSTGLYAAPGGPQTKTTSKTAPPPDVVVLSDGDRIYGTFVREVGGKVTFHSEILGDLVIPWEKITELHTQTKMAILEKNTVQRRHQLPANLPDGALSITNSMITVHPENNAMIEPIPVANAAYVIDDATLRKQVLGHPSFFAGWNGAATAGDTTVSATQHQYTFTAGVALVRVVPTVTFLDPDNRTSFDFTESYGKIDTPGVPSSEVKSSILHADAERDEYISTRAYVLGLLSFDHNFSQSLQLQSIYGGGLGYTIIKTPKSELDVKGTIQYERQSFIDQPSSANMSLVGSTFALQYTANLPHGMVFNQQFAYIPAYNNLHAYSANETDTLAFPTYKNFGFSVGTLDSYLNDPPATIPPTQRNSFQFTVGVTYAIKSKY